MPDEPVGDLVRPRRTTRATIVPTRIEHEVLHDELTRPVEEVEQVRLPAGPFEAVVLVDRDHRKLTALDVQRVPRSRQRLLLDEPRLPRSEPLGLRNDLRKTH